MNTESKLIAAVALCPVIADYLEDCIDDGAIRFKMKQEANKLIAQIRRFDKLLMDTASIEVVEEQIQLQQWIRQELFKQVK